MSEESWLKSLNQLRNNTNSIKSFRKRFFAEYDAFWMLKFVHFARDNFFSDSSLLDNVNSYLSTTENIYFDNVVKQLNYLRNIDKKQKKRDS